ncbi:MAG: hypothetical protein IJQ83_06140 [Bacteroidales bacterium]|nr:hypothetical protein [Bacteroidales bacterium]
MKRKTILALLLFAFFSVSALSISVQWHEKLKKEFTDNLLKDCKVTASDTSGLCCYAKHDIWSNTLMVNDCLSIPTNLLTQLVTSDFFVFRPLRLIS